MLPRAFGILEGVDSGYARFGDSRNDVLVLEKSAAEHCASLLRIDLGSREPLWVQSKHFYGLCYVVSFDGLSKVKDCDDCPTKQSSGPLVADAINRGMEVNGSANESD